LSVITSRCTTRVVCRVSSGVADRQSSGNVGGSNLPRFLWLMRVV
jgi:hypothetical protein